MAFVSQAQLPDEPQVGEVARQPVHAVHHHRVALTREGQQHFQFQTPPVVTGSLVAKEANARRSSPGSSFGPFFAMELHHG